MTTFALGHDPASQTDRAPRAGHCGRVGRPAPRSMRPAESRRSRGAAGDALAARRATSSTGTYRSQRLVRPRGSSPPAGGDTRPPSPGPDRAARRARTPIPSAPARARSTADPAPACSRVDRRRALFEVGHAAREVIAGEQPDAERESEPEQQRGPDGDATEARRRRLISDQPARGNGHNAILSPRVVPSIRKALLHGYWLRRYCLEGMGYLVGAASLMMKTFSPGRIRPSSRRAISSIAAGSSRSRRASSRSRTFSAR